MTYKEDLTEADLVYKNLPDWCGFSVVTWPMPKMDRLALTREGDIGIN